MPCRAARSPPRCRRRTGTCRGTPSATTCGCASSSWPRQSLGQPWWRTWTSGCWSRKRPADRRTYRRAQPPIEALGAHTRQRMTIAITQPVSPAQIGPGIYVYLTLGGFSVDAGDLIYLNGAASTLQGTNQLLAGQTIFAVQIGWDEHGGNFLAPAAGAVAGDTFDLQVSW